MLFLLTLLLCAAVTAVFSNDGSILVMTPVVYHIIKEVKLSKKQVLPFLLSVGFVCDSTSLPFSISNLVNIISTGYFSIPFLEYARIMIVPDIASVAVSLLILFLIFRKDLRIPANLDNLPDPKSILADPLVFRVSVIVVCVLVAAYAVAGLFLFPISIIAVPGVLGLFAFVRTRTQMEIRSMLRSTPWGIILFSFGMFLIVDAISNNGLTWGFGKAITLLHSLPGPVSYVFLAMLFSMAASVMNNLPSVIAGNLAISSVHLQNLVYLNVLANDVGTKFTPVGSLATLLWINYIRARTDYRVSYAYFLKISAIVTFPVIVVASVILWAVQLI